NSFTEQASNWSVLLGQIDILGISPGLSPLQEPAKTILSICEERKIAVWSEIEFFARALNALHQMALEGGTRYQPSILAITGTNGKTTTSALTAQICERAGRHVALAGNISPAALEKLSAVLKEAKSFDDLPQIWVLELSSFQLHFTHTLNPTASTILNLSQDHLDWHGDMNSYAAAKARILGSDSVLVLNRDDPLVNDVFRNVVDHKIISFGSDAPNESDSFGIERDLNGGGIDWLVWAEPDEATQAMAQEEAQEGFIKRRRKKNNAYEASDTLRLKRLIPADALRIRGRHNALNALAALALARAAGLGIGLLLHGLREYQGEPHRVQTVAVIRDVEYIDDSKGTNVGATVAALMGLGAASGQKNIWLIAGGDGKGQDFTPLSEPIERFVKGLIVIGRDGPAITTVCSSAVSRGILLAIEVKDLESAVQSAAQYASAGDIVLLSPACASFDMFKNYQHRAEVFVGAVHELMNQWSDSPNEHLGASA
ncbi:MAG: UDP-N-acetylmuramoyl-L-alanine--D-glutamate ligase, partial [Burkholderiaceae bacterium]|nr:UDP-N-acetylmuramoyl-L-alanine--D-glutamate ligase [Burkholderiaceae bacterium]